MYTTDQIIPFYEKWKKALNIDMMLTRECDLRCKHCLMDGYQGYMEFDLFKDVVDQLANMEKEAVFLSGGEIFTHKKIREILMQLFKKGIGAATITNGQNISYTNIDAIKDSQLKIAISLDGKEEIHNSIRNNKNAFKATEMAIDLCLRQGVEIALICSVARENLHEVDWIIDYCISRGIPSVRFQTVFGQGSGKKLEKLGMLLSGDEEEEFYRKIIRISPYYIGRLKIQSVGVFKHEVQTHGCRLGLKFGGDCHGNSPPWPLTISVDPSGVILPFSPHVSHDYKIGHASDGIEKCLENYYASDSHMEFLEVMNYVYDNHVLNCSDEYKEFGGVLLETLRK